MEGKEDGYFGYEPVVNGEGRKTWYSCVKISTINAILREFVMSKVSCDEMRNMDMIVELLRQQLEVTKEDIEPVIIMGLYHHRDLIGSPSSFIKAV